MANSFVSKSASKGHGLTVSVFIYLLHISEVNFWQNMKMHIVLRHEWLETSKTEVWDLVKDTTIYAKTQFKDSKIS